MNCKKLILVILISFFAVVQAVDFHDEIDDVVIDRAVLEKKMKQLSIRYSNLGNSYYQDESFDEQAEIDWTQSLAPDTYLEEYNQLDSKLIIPRIRRASEYKEMGNIDRFYEIAQDVIKRYPLSKYSAKAAFLIGEFEALIFNLELAQAFFTYVVNVHYYSEVGPKAVVQLVQVLEKRDYHVYAEKLLFKLLEESNASFFYEQLVIYLYTKTVARALWFWKQKNYAATYYYYGLYQRVKLEKTFYDFDYYIEKEVDLFNHDSLK